LAVLKEYRLNPIKQLVNAGKALVNPAVGLVDVAV